MCSCCMCCCCDEHADSASISSWLSGRFQRYSPETEKEAQHSTVITIETSNAEEQNSIATITQPTLNSSAAAPVLPVVKEETPRGSLTSGTTYGEYPNIDVRLNLFEDQRFKDVSEAIFKKHTL